MSVTDQLLSHAERYAAEFDNGQLPLPSATKVAAMTCLDARLFPTRVLGLPEGDAHVIRNEVETGRPPEVAAYERSASSASRTPSTRSPPGSSPRASWP